MAKNDDSRISDLLQELFVQQDGLKKLLEALLHTGMKAEVDERLSAKHYERSSLRRGHRNGTKQRTLKTRVGELKVDVPQVRGCEPYHPSMFAKWQRSERALPEIVPGTIRVCKCCNNRRLRRPFVFAREPVVFAPAMRAKGSCCRAPFLMWFRARFMQGIAMAASLLMTIPVIVIFFLAQKHFIQGVTLTGMKQ